MENEKTPCCVCSVCLYQHQGKQQHYQSIIYTACYYCKRRTSIKLSFLEWGEVQWTNKCNEAMGRGMGDEDRNSKELTFSV